MRRQIIDFLQGRTFEELRAIIDRVELSEKVGVANVNLSKMKTGKISAVRFSTLNAICKVLKCQPGEILEYAEDED